MRFTEKDRPQIDYPCQWQYKIIGRDADAMRRAVSEILPERKQLLSFSHSSSTGKYTSLLLQIRVISEADRNSIFQALRDHPSVNFVL